MDERGREKMGEEGAKKKLGNSDLLQTYKSSRVLY